MVCKDEVRVPKSQDHRLHKPYPCNQTFVTHHLCSIKPKRWKKDGKNGKKRERSEPGPESGESYLKGKDGKQSTHGKGKEGMSEGTEGQKVKGEAKGKPKRRW
jgi:hypothetical protein